jgi:hypothetical protein
MKVTLPYFALLPFETALRILATRPPHIITIPMIIIVIALADIL